MMLPVEDGPPWQGIKGLAVVRGVDVEGGAEFVMIPLVSRGVYRIEDVAVCHSSPHRAPSLHCRCGFNAFTERETAVSYATGLGWRNLAVARVELAGVVIEHDEGARGSHQRILEVSWAARCWGCDAEPHAFAEFRSSQLLHPDQRCYPSIVDPLVVVGPTCGRCGSNQRSVAELKGELGCSVSLDPTLVTAPERSRPARQGLRRHLIGLSAAVLALVTAFVILSLPRVPSAASAADRVAAAYATPGTDRWSDPMVGETRRVGAVEAGVTTIAWRSTTGRCLRLVLVDGEPVHLLHLPHPRVGLGALMGCAQRVRGFDAAAAGPVERSDTRADEGGDR
jgi:hypothetical protein